MATTLRTNETTPDAPDIETRMRIEVRDIGIPPRPAILEQIDREMRRDEPDYRRLAEVIGSDVGLAASLIKTTNSPYFGFARKIRSVQEALLVLGLKVIVRTVAGLALQKTFPHVPSLERFWDASASTARVSGWLAQTLGRQCRVKADHAYTFALFRDCGVPVLMIPFPEYPAVLKAANEEPDQPFTAVEDRLMSINHAMVGAELAENWLLPEDIFLAIRHHHDLAALTAVGEGALPESACAVIAVAQTAEYLLQRHTGRNRTCEWKKLGSACCDFLQLGEADLESLFDASREAVFAQGD